MRKLFIGILCSFLFLAPKAQTKISVIANKPGAVISPAMWGVFFEDINFAADGGLYAECNEWL